MGHSWRRAGFYQVTKVSSFAKWARGGRRIVRRPARLRQAIGGPDRVPGPTLRPDPPKPGKQGRVGHNLILPADYDLTC